MRSRRHRRATSWPKPSVGPLRFEAVSLSPVSPLWGCYQIDDINAWVCGPCNRTKIGPPRPPCARRRGVLATCQHITLGEDRIEVLGLLRASHEYAVFPRKRENGGKECPYMPLAAAGEAWFPPRWADEHGDKAAKPSPVMRSETTSTSPRHGNGPLIAAG